MKTTPDRQERLAAALRENLKRRKVQARERESAEMPVDNSSEQLEPPSRPR